LLFSAYAMLCQMFVSPIRFLLLIYATLPPFFSYYFPDAAFDLRHHAFPAFDFIFSF